MVGRHVSKRVPPPDAQCDFDLLAQLISSRTICLVDHENVCDFHHAGLECLNAVPRLGNQRQHRGVGHPGYIELRLADTDRLDQDAIEAGGVEQITDLARGGGEPAERSAAGHGPDVYAFVQRDGFHPDAIAQECTTGKRAGRIDRHDRHLETGRAVVVDQTLYQGGLACAGWACNANATSPAEQPVNLTEKPLEAGPGVLNHRDRPGQCGGVAGHQLRDQAIDVHGVKGRQSPEVRQAAPVMAPRCNPLQRRLDSADHIRHFA
jgi:hypothetical protein